MQAQTGKSQNLSKREFGGLIGSDKVEGTDVYRSNGDKIGKIERVMIDKVTGSVAYAVMSFGGFLGLGNDYYPIPWSLLTYNERLGGYEVELAEAQLKGAPKFRHDETWEYTDRDRESQLYSFYGVTPYW
jgi:PRC-barrel domain